MSPAQQDMLRGPFWGKKQDHEVGRMAALLPMSQQADGLELTCVAILCRRLRSLRLWRGRHWLLGSFSGASWHQRP